MPAPAPPKTLSEAIAQRSRELKPGEVEAGGRIYPNKEAYRQAVDTWKRSMQDAIAWREGLPKHPMDREDDWT